MKVTLLDHTHDPVSLIGEAAAICYDAKTDRESNIKRAKHCKSKGHLSTLRFAYATFNIKGISRVCSHQLVRIAHAGILQESQRYVEQTDIQWTIPPGMENTNVLIFLHHAKLLYNNLIDSGFKKEDATYVLPQACNTQLNVTMNFQGWRDFLTLRTSKSAQWEIRDVAIEIQRQLAEIAPEIFEEE